MTITISRSPQMLKRTLIMAPNTNIPRFYKKGMVFLVILVLAGIECNTAFVRNATIGAAFGGIDVPCTNWPPLETARRILSEHSGTVRQLYNVPDAYIQKILVSDKDGFDWFSKKCPGRGVLIIQTWANYEERMMMREIIGDDQFFFGVPYVMFDS